MSQSFVRQISHQENRYIGNTLIYNGQIVNIDNPLPFTFDINISTQVPLPERSEINLVVSGEPGTDVDGTIYSGQFRIRRNASTGNPSITVSGSDITSSQISTIKNSISVIENASSDGLDSIVNLNVSLTPIARAGARFFDITIPFDDDNITTLTNNIVIPFLKIDALGRDASFVNPIHVIIDNGEMIIDAGPIANISPVFIIRPNYAASRNISNLNISYEPILNNGGMILTYDEDLTNKEAIRIIPNLIPSLPSTDGTITTLANYEFKIASTVWKHVSTGIFTDVYSDIYPRLYYNIRYGIGSGDTPMPMFEFFVRATSSASISFAYSSTSAQITVQVNDTVVSPSPPNPDPLKRKPFTIENRYTNPFTRIALNIDRSNQDNNSFVIEGWVNNAPASMSIINFSNDSTIEDFLTLIKETIRTQFPAWYNDPAVTPSRGLIFNANTDYSLGSVRDLESIEILNLETGSLVDNIYIKPINAGQSFSVSTYIYNQSTNVDMSFQDLFDWFRTNLGSYGLYFKWYVPNFESWRNLKLVPIVINSLKPTTNLISNGIYVPYVFKSVPNCFISKVQTSSQGETVNYSETPNDSRWQGRDVIKFTSLSLSVGDFASYLASELNRVITNIWPSDPNNRLPQKPVIECIVPSYYKNLPSNTYIKFSTTTSPGFLGYSQWPFVSPSTYSTYSYYQHPSLNLLSSGNTLLNVFSKINLTGNYSSDQILIPIVLSNNLQSLIDTINDPDSSQNINSLIRSELVDNSYASISQNAISRIGSWDVSENNLYVSASVESNFRKIYDFARYRTLQSIVDAINLDWSTNITITIDPSTDLHADALSSHLISSVDETITLDPLPKVFYGTVSSIEIPSIPTANVKLRFNVSFADVLEEASTAPFYGVQVSFGGYEKDGVFFYNEAPNPFSEPVYNSVFPINFTSIDADVVYLLVRTRIGLDAPTYTSVSSNYSGMVRYDNGYSPHNVIPYKPTETKFTSVWEEDGLGVPTVIAIPVFSTTMDVSIEDTFVFDSINIKITNKPSELDQFGFLAINRTNNNQSQKQSKVAETFGLVLDNRGSWDILISPEATLSESFSGSISYLNNFYDRTVFDDDEGYDFSIISDIPNEVKNSISIFPVPGNPQVWVLRLEYGVKKYLKELISQNNDKESLVGCYLNIDLSITGRTTNVQGTARVVVYYDYTCVYDVGLCDFFWNLIDPPKPSGPEIIQNRLTFTYQTLVDCGNITIPSNDNIAINAPVLINILNIPTFRNGNALLLIKSFYTPEIQSFYYPTGNELDSMQYTDCSAINLNLPLIQKLNKEFLLLPNQENPINDVAQIRNLINTSDSYLWVKPQFNFPPDDNIKDCSPNEIVLISIGYVFKNWSNGTRQDDVLLGVNLLFPQNVFSSPEMNICYRYYYNQRES